MHPLASLEWTWENKYEIRISKFETNSNDQNSKSETLGKFIHFVFLLYIPCSQFEN